MPRVEIARKLTVPVGCLAVLIALGVAATGAGGAELLKRVKNAPKYAPATSAYSFQGSARSATKTMFAINSLIVNARCDSAGRPVIYAFTTASRANLFGNVVDGRGGLHKVVDDAFTNRGKGVSLVAGITADRDADGTLVYERSDGRVVSFTLAFDNSPTLAGAKVCTVYGVVSG